MKNEINPELIDVGQISDYLELLGYDKPRSTDPLVGVIECDRPYTLPQTRVRVNYYSVFINKGSQRNVNYGNGQIRYDCNSIGFTEPGQVFDIGPFERGGKEVPPQLEGLGVLVHPDYLVGTSLLKRMGKYNFLSYKNSEAVLVRPESMELLEKEIRAINKELLQPSDIFTREIVISRLTTLFNLCERISNRLSANDSAENAHNAANIMSRFESVVVEYFRDKASTEGFPTVKYLAKEFGLSYPYFSDLIRRSSGVPVVTHLHNVAIQIAKEKLISTDESVAEISKSLGFQYPNHFSRLFRRYVNVTPSEFRQKATSGR